MCGSETVGLCWPSSSTRVINSLWPNDTICHNRTWSTLVQVMACNLTAPSHCQNQCWLNHQWGPVRFNKLVSQQIIQISLTEMCFKIMQSKLQPLFLKDQWVTATIQQTIRKWFSVCYSYLQSKIGLHLLNDCNGSFLKISFDWETSISELSTCSRDTLWSPS